jgi:hypothetical protein
LKISGKKAELQTRLQASLNNSASASASASARAGEREVADEPVTVAVAKKKSKEASKPKPKKTAVQKLLGEEAAVGGKRVPLSPLVNSANITDEANIAKKKYAKNGGNGKKSGKISKNKKRKLFSAADSYSHLMVDSENSTSASSAAEPGSMYASIASSAAQFKYQKQGQFDRQNMPMLLVCGLQIPCKLGGKNPDKPGYGAIQIKPHNNMA